MHPCHWTDGSRGQTCSSPARWMASRSDGQLHHSHLRQRRSLRASRQDFRMRRENDELKITRKKITFIDDRLEGRSTISPLMLALGKTEAVEGAWGHLVAVDRLIYFGSVDLKPVQTRTMLLSEEERGRTVTARRSD